MAKDSLLSFTKDVKDRTALRYHLNDSTKEMGKRKSWKPCSQRSDLEANERE